MKVALQTSAVVLVLGVIAVLVFLFVPNVTNAPMDDTSKLSLTSSAFEHNGTIPSKYTCDGDNVNPPLTISGVPEDAVSLVLVMDDPDIPKVFKEQNGIDSFDHWTLYGLSPDTKEILEGKVVGSEGLNGAGESGYTGPCPPTEYEPTEHRYFFKLFALDSNINFIKAPTKSEVLTAIEGHILDKTELVGRYGRSGKAQQ